MSQDDNNGNGSDGGEKQGIVAKIKSIIGR